MNPRLAPITDAIPTASQINVSAGAIAAVGGTAIALITVLVFPTELINAIVEDNYSEVVGRFAWARRWGAALRKTRQEWARIFGALLYVFTAGLIATFVQPGFAFNERTGLLVLSTSLAMGIPLTVVAATEIRAMGRVIKHRGRFAVRPGTLLLSLATVLISRLFDVVPGYLFGIIAGVVYARELSPRERGQANQFRALARLSIAVIAWLLLGPARAAADAGGALVHRRRRRDAGRTHHHLSDDRGAGDAADQVLRGL